MVSETTTPIILLEDDRSLRSLIADGLQAARYTVVETGSTQAAVAAISAAHGKAILVADRQIESQQTGTNGFQAAAQALEQHPMLRVIYVSGNHMAVRRRLLSDRERALLKPFAMSQLLTLVRELG